MKVMRSPTKTGSPQKFLFDSYLGKVTLLMNMTSKERPLPGNGSGMLIAPLTRSMCW